ncbi:PSP1-domain-containing protein [Coprinellus micaceus]|uniref:PSP1-domain-containing protein n=1 Tax=Coprinellus micaceus TaxID=71717 RepID=A0A4Y7TM20_COPMI|nr:PSP1-domain-containing protein [Coprinellus micaceus]
MTTLDHDFDEVYGGFSSAFQPSSVTDTSGRTSLRDRAASQPPRNSEQGYVSSPSSQHFVPSSLGVGGSPWSSSRLVGSTNRGQPMPIRSSSLTSQNQNQFGSVMRERAFPSTLEDEEPEDYDDDTYDEQFIPPSIARGRSYGQDFSRSRSQSLANARPGPVGSPYLGGSAMQSWNDSYLSSNSSNPLNISTGGRGYESLQPSGTSRYGSLGTLARSPSNNLSSSPSPGGALVGNGYSRLGPQADGSNMSPFRRDVGQILRDDGPFHELWAGMNPPRDESGGGGGSGTTSRRHSVSLVQPRRGIVQGFNAPGNDAAEEQARPTFKSAFSRQGGLVLSDDELASDLGTLNLGPRDTTPPGSTAHHPPSQPASLPIYAPLSRSPPSKDLFQPMANVPASSYNVSRPIGTPSDNGTESPTTRTAVFFDNDSSQYFNVLTPQANPRAQQQQSQQQHSDLPARYVPGQGIQYISQQRHSNALSSNGATNVYPRQSAFAFEPSGTHVPISPTGTRLINPQQQPFYPQQIQRRTSDAAQHPHQGPGGQPQQNLNELGKGVPLSAVPASCPLFIVEFKAGRTDLFYLNESTHDIKVGDIVIVEADRGKDLGKVVNDTITLGEVEAYQKSQAEKAAAAAGFGGGSDQPTSPGGATPGSKKEINPKMIYGKASPQDTQLLAQKLGDEQKALQLCQSKVRAKKLPMEVIDAEYQWDRRKLTFYFIAEKRIDFRELVRELFRLYKTRIWMASLQGPNGYEQ